MDRCPLLPGVQWLEDKFFHLGIFDFSGCFRMSPCYSILAESRSHDTFKILFTTFFWGGEEQYLSIILSLICLCRIQLIY